VSFSFRRNNSRFLKPIDYSSSESLSQPKSENNKIRRICDDDFAVFNLEENKLKKYYFRKMAPKNTDVDKKKTEKEADPLEKIKDSGIPEEGELSEEDQELK